MELKDKFRAIAIEEEPQQRRAEMPAGVNHREKFFSNETRETVIGMIAQEIYDRRMSDSDNPAEKEYEGLPLYGDEIERLLRRNGIKKDTEKARKFMEKWDFDQAVNIYERMFGKQKGEREISVIAAETEEKKDTGKYIWPEVEKDPIKAMALHTFVRLPNFEDVNADTEEEGVKKVNDMADILWGDPTVHGFPDPDNRDPKTGEPVIARRTDLDGRGFLAILKIAGIKFDMKSVDYVKQSDSSRTGKGIVGDTAGEDGVVAKNFGEVLIFDHHGGKSGRDTSATRNAYKALVDDGKIEQSNALDAFVEFVTKEDNKDYTDEECKKIIENFDGNLIGLQRYMNGEDVIRVFEEYAAKDEELDPYEKLPPKILDNLKFENSNGEEMELKDVLQKLKNTKEALKREVEAMKNEEFVIETDQYGTILIDAGRLDGKSKKIKKRLGSNLDIEAARAAGHGGVVWWNPNANSFSIKVANQDFDFSLPEGDNYRGRYWLKGSSQERMKTTLEEILGKLTGQENFQLDEKLKLALEGGKKGKKKEATEEQKKLLADMVSRFPFQKVIENISQNLSEEKREKGQRIRESFVREAKMALEDISRNFSEKEVGFFMNEMMDQILAYYRGEKGKTKGSDELKKMRATTIGFIKDIAEKKGFDKKSVDYIARYFRNIFQIEFLTNNSK